MEPALENLVAAEDVEMPPSEETAAGPCPPDDGREQLATALRETGEVASRALDAVGTVSSDLDSVGMNVRMVSAMIGTLMQGVEQVWTSSDAPGRAAREALASVQAATGQVADLATLSGQIADIVGVIDAITHTTNVLALNAAIEAAHAGDLGRGFAVVASEVKSLSKQTQEATIEIRSKIERMQEAMERALMTVRTTQTSVESIHAMVGRLSQAVESQTELSASVRTYACEAADSVDGISRAIETMNTELSETVERCRGALGDVAA